MSSATAPRVQPVHFYPSQSTLQFGIRAIAGRFNRARWWSIGITQMLFFGLCWAQWQGRPLVSFDLVRQQVHLFGGLFGPQDLLLLTLLLIGGALAIGLALFQFWGDWVSIGVVAAIFAAGQFIEGNILTPKLVGKSVGLHPVWLMFALSVFGSLFGFVGMLIAVPMAAAIGVLTRFALAQYQASLLYQGVAGRIVEDEDHA